MALFSLIRLGDDSSHRVRQFVTVYVVAAWFFFVGALVKWFVPRRE